MRFFYSAFCICTSLMASEVTWIGPNNGDWNAPGNWSSKQVPTALSTALFQASYGGRERFDLNVNFSDNAVADKISTNIISYYGNLSFTGSKQLTVNSINFQTSVSFFQSGEILTRSFDITADTHVKSNGNLTIQKLPFADALLEGRAMNARMIFQKNLSVGKDLVITDGINCQLLNPSFVKSVQKKLVVKAGGYLTNSSNLVTHGVLNDSVITNEGVWTNTILDVNNSNKIINRGTINGNILNGKIKNDGTINGNLTLNSKTDYSGRGTLNGNSSFGGTIHPGGSPGIMTINGNVTLNSLAVVEIETDFLSPSRIDVSGTCTIQPNVRVLMIPDKPEPSNWRNFLVDKSFSFTFVHAGSISGTFASVSSAFPGYGLSMAKEGNQYILSIQPIPLASLVSNSNQTHVAQVFDRDSASQSEDFIYVNSELYFLQVPQLQEALDQLHPALFQSVALAQEETTTYITKILSQRLEEITWKSKEGKDTSWDIWGQGLRDYARQKGKHTLSGYTATTPGIIVGADVKIDAQFALGFHGAYTNTHIDWERKQGHGHTTCGYGGLYGSWYTKNFLLGLSFLGGWTHTKASRNIVFGDIDRKAHHRVHGWELAPQIEIGGLWDVDYISLEPFLKENYVYLHQNHYRESGAESLDLSVHSKNADLLRSELGLGLFHTFAGNQLQFTPEVKLSYIYESRFQGKKTTAYFLNDTVNPFTVEGLSPSRSLGHLGALLKGSTYNGFVLTLDYNFLFGKKYQDHKMALRMDYAF